MKNRDYKMAALKRKILDYEFRRVKVLTWSLNQEQVEYIQLVLGKKVVPYLYKIKTRSFHQIRNVRNNLLKDLHYANKRGKDFLVRQLNVNEKDILKENNINYTPIKYNIYLN